MNKFRFLVCHQYNYHDCNLGKVDKLHQNNLVDKNCNQVHQILSSSCKRWVTSRLLDYCIDYRLDSMQKCSMEVAIGSNTFFFRKKLVFSLRMKSIYPTLHMFGPIQVP